MPDSATDAAPAATTDRHEVILRLPNLTEGAAQHLVKFLRPVAERCGGKLTEVVREHHEDYSVHKRRKKHV